MQIILQNLCLNDILLLDFKTTRNHCIQLFQSQNNKKSLHTIISTFSSVAQKLFSFDSPKFKFQIQSEANQCIQLFQIQNNNKSLH